MSANDSKSLKKALSAHGLMAGGGGGGGINSRSSSPSHSAKIEGSGDAADSSKRSMSITRSNTAPPGALLKGKNKDKDNGGAANGCVSSSSNHHSKSSNHIAIPRHPGSSVAGTLQASSSGSSLSLYATAKNDAYNTNSVPGTPIIRSRAGSPLALGGSTRGLMSNPFSMTRGSENSSTGRDLLASRGLSRAESRGYMIGGVQRRSNYDDILVEPWCLDFIYDQEKLLFPKKILTEDFLGKKSPKVLDISNWKMCPSAFILMKNACKSIEEFKCDHTNIKNQLLTVEHLRAFRGYAYLRSVSLRGSVTVNDDVAKLLGSLKELKELDISENELCDVALSIMSQSCSSLRSLKMRKCTGITDFGMQYIASHMLRFRKLSELDFAGCKSFTDEGSLQVMVAAPTLLSSISFSECTQLTSLTITACRQKLPGMLFMNLSKINLGQSCYEWIAEGCRNVTHLDLTNCFELDSIGLQMIGRKCSKLKLLKLENCLKINDADVDVFFTEVSLNNNSLEVFSLNGCIYCGDLAVLAIAKVNCMTLREVYLNGLCKISSHSLEVLLQMCTSLQIFDMSLETKVAITHRQSVLPHITDTALQKISCARLSKFNICGSALITDAGIGYLVKRCTAIKYLDISYCNHLTDLSLDYISQYLKQIETLIVSGNIHVTDVGIMHLSSRLPTLQNLEFNGCATVSDEGVRTLSMISELKSVHMRGCYNVTPVSLEKIAMNCPKLKSVDVSSIDLVTLDLVRLFFQCCMFLTAFSCEGCAFTTREFSMLCKDNLPLAEWAVPNCKLQPRHPNVVNFNKYVIKMQEYHRKIVPIQKLVRCLCFNIWLFRANKAKNRSARLIERVYNQFVKRKNRMHKEKHKTTRRDAIVIIQRWARKQISMIFARRKKHKLGLLDRARRNIQRVYRGHMGRKRMKRQFQHLYSWYTKIGRIVHKYWVVMAARSLHRKICLVQSTVKMFIVKMRFKRVKKGVLALELVVIERIRRRTECRIVLNKLVDLLVLRDSMVTKIQRTMKACLFNKNMSPFILISCIYYRCEYDKNTWNQNIIARYWRGFIVRIKAWREKMRPTWEYNAATKIQTQVRGRQARRVRRNIILKQRKNMFRWKRFVLKRPRLRICQILKVIQRAYKAHFIWKRIHTYVSNIQKTFRGWLTRKRVAKMKLERIDKASGIIARKYRRYKAYWWRREKICLEHMKAFKIQRWIKRKLNADALRRIQAAKTANKRRKEKEEKAHLQALKRGKYVAKLRLMFINRYASKIQRVYRKWHRERTKKRKALENRQRALAEAKEEILEMRLERAAFSFALNPVQMYRNFKWFLENTFKAHGLDIAERDTVKLETAILTEQTQTLLQEGIVDLHMTYGVVEKKNFFKAQEQSRKSSKPYFVRLEGDVSGKLGLMAYIWVMYGKGKQCICLLEVDAKPPTSLVATRNRVEDSRGQGIKIAWHPDVHVEFRGVCTMLQDKGGYAIQDIKIVFTVEEGDALAEQGYLRVKNLIPLGFFSAIYSKNKKPDEDPDLFKQPTLQVRTWADKRLLKVVKSFNLLESEVLLLRKSFEAILGVRIAESLNYTEMAQHFGFHCSQMFKWVCNAVNPEKRNELSFSEYVHMVSYFSMFTRDELIKFLFGNMDPEKLGYLSEEGWSKFCDILCEEGPYNPSPWKKQFKNYYDKKLKMLFCAQFDKFSAQFPQSLWVAQEMQKKIKTFNLGEMFWEGKMNKYRIVREKAGIKLVK